jgi:hypothetical protein
MLVVTAISVAELLFKENIARIPYGMFPFGVGVLLK